MTVWPDVNIRAALPGEWALIVAQRRAMFAAMRELPGAQLGALDVAFGPWVAERLERGDYHGWFGVNHVRPDS